MKENDNLIRRYLDDIYTRADADCLLDKCAAPGFDDTVKECMSSVWDESLSMQSCSGTEHDEYYGEAMDIIRKSQRRKLGWVKRCAIYAAGLAAVICIGWGVDIFWNYKKIQSIYYLEVATAYGEMKELCMPDGTKVVLNSSSSISYPESFEMKERRVKLEGEGFFQVHRDESMPFIVSTNCFEVKVLGTSFNVKSYSTDNIVSVEVESGKVQVDMPEAMIRLQAHESITINTMTGDYLKEGNIENEAQWRNGTLRFNRTPIHDVAKELERMYGCRIRFAEGEEFNNCISGEHDNRSLKSVLATIELTTGLKYKIEGDDVLIYK